MRIVQVHVNDLIVPACVWRFRRALPFAAITAAGSLGATLMPGDADGLARALTEVCSRDIAALSRRASDRAERFFRWPAIGRRAMMVYREVIARRRARLTARRAA